MLGFVIKKTRGQYLFSRTLEVPLKLKTRGDFFLADPKENCSSKGSLKYHDLLKKHTLTVYASVEWFGMSRVSLVRTGFTVNY